MPSLSDKLKSLGVQVGARNLPPPRRSMPADFPIEAVVAGADWLTACGPVFVAETRYSPEHRHGQVGLWPQTSLAAVAGWLQDNRLAQCGLHQIGFLDTETSGLAGGTGTYAFLVGAARFDGDAFWLAQFFMRDPTAEPALLAALTEFLQPCRALVTFNGKSFDAPLLNTRYTLNGRKSPLPELAHLDLLPLARGLWRDRLPSRSLGNLERAILQCERTGEDTPGWLIPQLYFDYLRTGDARPLAGVFYHNRLDVVAMAALLNQMAHMLANPLGEAVQHALDLVAIGKLFEALGQIEAAAQVWAEGLQRNDLPEAHYWDIQQRLALLEKRRGNWDAAVAGWQLAADGRQLYAHIELAKYFEHRRRDYATALRWTLAAQELLNRAAMPAPERRTWLADLKQRQTRLRRKLAAKEP